MAWTIEFVPAAVKDPCALDRQVARRIVRTLEEGIAASEDPRTLGAPLAGEHGYWRWRIGDYRVIVGIEDERVTVLVACIAHRRAAHRSATLYF